MRLTDNTIRSKNARPSTLPVVKVRSRRPSVAEPRPLTNPRAVEKQIVSKRLMVEALKSSKGNVAHACKLAGISRMTHYRWTRDDPEYAAAFDDIGQEVVDNMETLFLKETVAQKDLRSMRWFLERKGKDRGYGKPSVQQFDEDGNPIKSIGVQNNIVVFREDVPGDSVAKALSDLLRNRPELLEQAKREPVPQLEVVVDADEVDEDDDELDEYED